MEFNFGRFSREVLLMTDQIGVFEKNAELFGDIYDFISNDDARQLSILAKANSGLLQIPMFGDSSDAVSLLHHAASIGALEVCKFLVDEGMDVNLIDGAYRTPLVYATGSGKQEVAFWLIERGADINGDCRGITTPLIESARVNDTELARRLIAQGADVNRLQCKFNQTALDTATVYGSEDTAELISRAGGMRAQEPIDLSQERASGILEHLFHNVGPILSNRLALIADDQAIDLRTALVGKGGEFKVLCTIGAYEITPSIEFMICLPHDWPLNDSAVISPLSVSFPAQLLRMLALRRLGGEAIAEGYVVGKQATLELSEIWPADVDAFVAVNYQFKQGAGNLNATGEVTLLMMVPVTYSKTGRPSAVKLDTWIGKQRVASWKKIALRHSM